eukprot:Hpha_TRINITY_DN5250_c0_g1::TRINITY_DN5250_c0_g1_i1::g.116633::m.116633/K01620/ltaE; threonine aldolase
MSSGYGVAKRGRDDEEVIDMRSDTVTKPTAEMREAMKSAIVGDDVYDEDPTVHLLEEEAAKLFGKEAAIFVTSGTQGNLCSIMSHCKERGSEVVVGDKSHICIYEQGGIATVAGVHPRHVANLDDGTLDLAAVEDVMRGDDVHFPRSRLLCLENTHNACGGVAISPEYIDKAGELCKRFGLKLHIDGARIAHACVAHKVTAARMVRSADSVTMCLSKGLGAPAGSVVAGSKDFIADVRRCRKVLGGGLRQVGVLAAPGRIAISKMWDRIAEDHALAAHLAESLEKALPEGSYVEKPAGRTNMVFVRTGKVPAKAVVAGLKTKGILAGAPKPDRIRIIVNYHITKDLAPRIISSFISAIKEAANGTN